MKALIIEDEMIAQAQLTRMLNAGFPEIEIVGRCESVRSSVAWLKANPAPDVIFMDVELADGDCFEIFRQVDVQSNVIMTTAYDTYAIKAFEAGSIDYLLKPIEKAALERAVGRTRAFKEVSIKKMLEAAEGGKKKYIERTTVRVGSKIIPVTINDLILVYSESKTNYILLRDGQRYMIDASINEVEADLDPEKFFRISRGEIVARSAIDTVGKHTNSRLLLKLKTKAPVDLIVARARVDDFLAWLG